MMMVTSEVMTKMIEMMMAVMIHHQRKQMKTLRRMQRLRDSSRKMKGLKSKQVSTIVTGLALTVIRLVSLMKTTLHLVQS
jgi:hypothetical protein